MKQFAVVYKPNRMPLAFYCTEKAGMERLLFITDDNIFGLFEVDVEIHNVLKEPNSYVQHNIGLVCTINNCLLSIHLNNSTAYKFQEAIKSGVFQVCDVEYWYGKEIKRPKNKEEE